MGLTLYEKQQHPTRRAFCLVSDLNPDYYLRITKSSLNPEGLAVEYSQQRHDQASLGSKAKASPFYGIFGFYRIGNDIFLLLVSSVKCLGAIFSSYIYQITSMDAYSLSHSRLDLPWRPIESVFDEAERALIESHPAFDILKYCTGGSFYFSYEIDLTNSLQKLVPEYARRGQVPLDLSTLSESLLGEPLPFNETFFWNKFMIQPLLRFVERLVPRPVFLASRLVVICISGFIHLSEFSSSPSLPRPSENEHMVLISRVGCERAGTRFLSRGIDDDGHVANFVESEFVMIERGMLYSLVQVRGSVPLFWEQQGIQIGQPKIQFTRSFEASQPAFKTHMDRLYVDYGSVHLISLLSIAPSHAESSLGSSYERHVSLYHPPSGLASANDLGLTNFDFNTVCRDSFNKISLVLDLVRGRMSAMGYFIFDLTQKRAIEHQKGVFRMNCLDCLDRTNVAQGAIAKAACEAWSKRKDRPVVFPTTAQPSFTCAFNTAWADHGDALSYLYTGTGALKSGYTRTGKRTLAGFMDDLRKTTRRFYVNNFQDKFRQKTIDLLLGKGPGQPLVTIDSQDSLSSRCSSLSQTDCIVNPPALSLYCLTFNMAAAEPYLLDYAQLFRFGNAHSRPDLLFVGFQEIVALSAQAVLTPDPARKSELETGLLKSLNQKARSESERYIILSSCQLVGLLLIVLVKNEKISHIRRVESLSRKTGFGGVAGNKGSVAIRFNIGPASMCIVNSHFASGPENTDIRNKEYESTLNESLFLSGLRFSSHSCLVWMGDFNYRMSVANVDTIRASLERRDYGSLLALDSLNLEKSRGRTMRGLTEAAAIGFAPTYKWIKHSDSLDLFQRVPGWTDRIFYSGPGLVCLDYQSIQSCRASDHRPVCALFSWDLQQANVASRSSVASSTGSQHAVLKVPEGILIEFETLCSIEKSASPPPLPARPSVSLIELDKNAQPHSPPPPLPSRPDSLASSLSVQTLSSGSQNGSACYSAPSTKNELFAVGSGWDVDG